MFTAPETGRTLTIMRADYPNTIHVSLSTYDGRLVNKDCDGLIEFGSEAFDQQMLAVVHRLYTPTEGSPFAYSTDQFQEIFNLILKFR